MSVIIPISFLLEGLEMMKIKNKDGTSYAVVNTHRGMLETFQCYPMEFGEMGWEEYWGIKFR